MRAALVTPSTLTHAKTATLAWLIFDPLCTIYPEMGDCRPAYSNRKRIDRALYKHIVSSCCTQPSRRWSSPAGAINLSPSWTRLPFGIGKETRSARGRRLDSSTIDHLRHHATDRLTQSPGQNLPHGQPCFHDKMTAGAAVPYRPRLD